MLSGISRPKWWNVDNDPIEVADTQMDGQDKKDEVAPTVLEPDLKQMRDKTALKQRQMDQRVSYQRKSGSRLTNNKSKSFSKEIRKENAASETQRLYQQLEKLQINTFFNGIKKRRRDEQQAKVIPKTRKNFKSFFKGILAGKNSQQKENILPDGCLQNMHTTCGSFSRNATFKINILQVLRHVSKCCVFFSEQGGQKQITWE